MATTENPPVDKQTHALALPMISGIQISEVNVPIRVNTHDSLGKVVQITVIAKRPIIWDFQTWEFRDSGMLT